MYLKKKTDIFQFEWLSSAAKKSLDITSMIVVYYLWVTGGFPTTHGFFRKRKKLCFCPVNKKFSIMGAAPCLVMTETTSSLDHVCGLTSISSPFEELFLLSRLHGNGILSHVDKSGSFSCARKGVHKKHFAVVLVPSTT